MIAIGRTLDRFESAITFMLLGQGLVNLEKVSESRSAFSLRAGSQEHTHHAHTHTHTPSVLCSESPLKTGAEMQENGAFLISVS